MFSHASSYFESNEIKYEKVCGPNFDLLSKTGGPILKALDATLDIIRMFERNQLGILLSIFNKSDNVICEKNVEKFT